MINNRNSDVIFVIIGVGCFFAGGILLNICGVDVISDTYSFRFPYRGKPIFLKPWIGVIITALDIIGLLCACIFLLTGIFSGSTTYECPFCAKKKKISKYGKYKCKKCGHKFIIESIGKVRKME